MSNLTSIYLEVEGCDGDDAACTPGEVEALLAQLAPEGAFSSPYPPVRNLAAGHDPDKAVWIKPKLPNLAQSAF